MHKDEPIAQTAIYKLITWNNTRADTTFLYQVKPNIATACGGLSVQITIYPRKVNQFHVSTLSSNPPPIPYPLHCLFVRVLLVIHQH